MGCTGCKKKTYNNYSKKIDKRTNIAITIVIVIIVLAIYGLISLIVNL